jgi:hypothetical protein
MCLQRLEQLDDVAARVVMLQDEVAVRRAHGGVVLRQVANQLLAADHPAGCEPRELVGLERGVQLRRHRAVGAEHVEDVDRAPARHPVERGPPLADDDVGPGDRAGDIEALARVVRLADALDLDSLLAPRRANELEALGVVAEQNGLARPLAHASDRSEELRVDGDAQAHDRRVRRRGRRDARVAVAEHDHEIDRPGDLRRQLEVVALAADPEGVPRVRVARGQVVGDPACPARRRRRSRRAARRASR